jgi:hypothetical protein
LKEWQIIAIPGPGKPAQKGGLLIQYLQDGIKYFLKIYFTIYLL